MLVGERQLTRLPLNGRNAIVLLQPHIGSPYDPFGDGKTVMRAGYGIFSNVPVADAVAQSHFNQPWLLRDIRFTVDFDDHYRGVAPKPFPFTPPQTGDGFSFQFPVNIESTAPHYADPRVQQWHMSVDRQLLKPYTFDLAYLGTVTHHLQMTYEENPARFIPGTNSSGNPLCTPGNIDQRRIYNPNHIASALFASASSNSVYHALQVTLENRLSDRLWLNTNYTFGRAIDSATSPSAAGNKAQNAFNLAVERGLSGLREHSTLHKRRCHSMSYVATHMSPNDEVTVIPHRSRRS